MTRLLISTSLAALGFASAALAQTAGAQSADQPVAIYEGPVAARKLTAIDQAAPNVSAVVVTATRTPTQKLKVADSLTVITARDIALKQQQTLPEVLEDAPGLNVVQSGPGGVASVFMRGADSNHVKVLIDGIDASDPSSPTDAFDFGQVLTGDIARVEILRGPQSGLYGSDAIGGVINIITESGQGAPHLTLSAEGGSFETANESGALAGSTGPFHYAATIQYADTSAMPVTPTNTLAPGEARNDDGWWNLTASTKLGYDVTDTFNLGLVARYTQSHTFVTGDDDFAFGFPDPVQSQTDDRQYYLRGVGNLTLFDGRFDQTLGVAYSNLASTDVTPNFGVSLFAGSRLKVDWQGDIKVFDGETLVLGAEDQHDAISQPLAASIDMAGGFAELQSTLFDNFNSTISVRYDDNSRFGGKATYRIAPTYFIEATGTKLAASVGTGFKAPSLSDLFQSFPAFGFFANPNLKPEESIGYDVGFEQYLWDKSVQFGATWFYNHITNLIADNAAFTTDINIGKAHTDGVESFVLVQPSPTLSFRVDDTYTDAIDDIAHDELIRRPRNKATFDVRWRPIQKLSLDATVLSVGSWIDGNRDFSIQRLTAPGYTTVNVAANYELTRQLTIYGRINNLFDAHYEDPFGFLRPSIGAFAGVKARF